MRGTMQAENRTQQLPPVMVARIMALLDLRPTAPDLPALRRLIAAYTRAVPWESASRIRRRAATPRIEDCPRWPLRFWQDALTLGCGGTCFESNYAFYALLCALGYEVYLTINNMDEQIGCHSAVVVTIDDVQYLADVGIPLYAPVELHPQLAASAVTPLMTYTAVPEDLVYYRIERAPHPQPYTFTLVNRPVDEPTYRAATTVDYGPQGLFLDRVIVNKIVAGRPWRFNSADDPPLMCYFDSGERFDQSIRGDVAAALAAQFGIDETILRAALLILARKS